MIREWKRNKKLYQTLILQGSEEKQQNSSSWEQKKNLERNAKINCKEFKKLI